MFNTLYGEVNIKNVFFKGAPLSDIFLKKAIKIYSIYNSCNNRSTPMFDFMA